MPIRQVVTEIPKPPLTIHLVHFRNSPTYAYCCILHTLYLKPLPHLRPHFFFHPAAVTASTVLPTCVFLPLPSSLRTTYNHQPPSLLPHKRISHPPPIRPPRHGLPHPRHPASRTHHRPTLSCQPFASHSPHHNGCQGPIRFAGSSVRFLQHPANPYPTPIHSRPFSRPHGFRPSAQCKSTR